MTPGRLDLRDVAEDPDRLLEFGYIRGDGPGTDTLRSVVYEKALYSDESQLKLLVQIHFELAISDDVGYDYSALCSYSFNGVYIEVLDRQMERQGNRHFDEGSEYPVSVGALRLAIDSLGEVERLVGLLKPGVSQW